MFRCLPLDLAFIRGTLCSSTFPQHEHIVIVSLLFVSVVILSTTNSPGGTLDLDLFVVDERVKES